MVDKAKPKILVAHNHYVERGGEDESFDVEKRLLQDHGHELCVYTRSNHEITTYSAAQYMTLPLRTIWARDSYTDILNLIKTESPSLAHFNNTFPLLSPAVYDACRSAGIPVIQNIRNYRLVCPNAVMFRDHHVCEDCLGRSVAWPGIVHACYRESKVQSGMVALMLAYHKLRKTWQQKVDVYIALTEFARKKLIAGGIPAAKIMVRPNFVPDRGVADEVGDYALFIGRIIEGKGVLTLLNAWKHCGHVQLKIVGDGPDMPKIRELIVKENLSNIELCGSLPSQKVFELLKRARFLIFPPLWYEAFPRVLIEAFSCGKPVIASAVGASTEIVNPDITGRLFAPNDEIDLANKVATLWGNLSDCRSMGQAARSEYEKKYTPSLSYVRLMDIYRYAMEQAAT